MVRSVYLSAKMIKATWDLHMCTPGRQEISHHHCPLPACLSVMWYTPHIQRGGERERECKRWLVEVLVVGGSWSIEEGRRGHRRRLREGGIGEGQASFFLQRTLAAVVCNGDGGRGKEGGGE